MGGLIGGAIAKILGSDSVIEKGMKGIDAVVFTKQEKFEMKIKLLKAYEPYHVALRLLSLSITGVYLLLASVLFVASFFIDNVDSQLALLKGDLGSAFVAVVSFYFLNSVMGKLRKDKD